jgi:DUF1680 family protein
VLATADGGRREFATRPGYLTVTETFSAGDVLELHLPIEPRVVVPDPRIDAVRGCVAIERGPEVLCVESPDLPADVPLERLALDRRAALEVDGDRVTASFVVRAAADQPWPYADTEQSTQAWTTQVALTPYHEWAERGPATMRVWMPAAD